MKMRNWTRIGTSSSYHIIVPDARGRVIRRHYQSTRDQRRQAALYYVNVYPEASWEHLAGQLYGYEEDRALEALKIQLPKVIGNHFYSFEHVHKAP